MMQSRFVRESFHTKGMTIPRVAPVEMSESGHYLTLFSENLTSPHFISPSINRKTSGNAVPIVSLCSNKLPMMGGEFLNRIFQTSKSRNAGFSTSRHCFQLADVNNHDSHVLLLKNILSDCVGSRINFPRN